MKKDEEVLLLTVDDTVDQEILLDQLSSSKNDKDSEIENLVNELKNIKEEIELENEKVIVLFHR